jgi:hypothetical protein
MRELASHFFEERQTEKEGEMYAFIYKPGKSPEKAYNQGC